MPQEGVRFLGNELLEMIAVGGIKVGTVVVEVWRLMFSMHHLFEALVTFYIGLCK